jgi:hypothetical protein
VNAGTGSYPDAEDEVDEWAIAPTSKHSRAKEPSPRLMSPSGFDREAQGDPNVPPPRILSPSGYVRDVDDWEKQQEAAGNQTAEIDWSDQPIEIPAGHIEPLEPVDPDDVPTGKVSGRSVDGYGQGDDSGGR